MASLPHNDKMLLVSLGEIWPKRNLAKLSNLEENISNMNQTSHQRFKFLYFCCLIRLGARSSS